MPFLCLTAIFLLGALWVSGQAPAQNETEYDEIAVFFNVPKVGGTDIPTLIRGETLYLSVTDVFDFLKIKNTATPGFDSISGFFINQQSAYFIDRLKNQIVYQQKEFNIQAGDMIRTETNLYLKSSYFGEIFGLQCAFNFRSLSVTLNTKIELPVIREMRQEQMRRNINQLKGEIKADTTIQRTNPMFHFGVADWSAISSQRLEGRIDTRLSLTLGSVIAGGEMNMTLNYNNNTPFQEKQQYYLWRYVNNDRQALRQVLAGKIATGATSSLYSPVVGVQFTNTPTTFRRSFGTYTLSDFTEPGWLVELYVNNVLVDYVKSDASGFFSFDVPLVYGNTEVKLQYYGPWGEEHSKEQNISIPFNFLPVGEFEYKASAGFVEDGDNSIFSRTALNYGLSRRITVGGGLEYLSSISQGTVMPFLSTSFRFASSLLVSGEYTYGVRVKGILNYRMPSNLQFELNYTNYKKGQQAINYNYLEERKVALSMPIRGKNFAAFSRLTLNQIVMPQIKYTTAELLLSGALLGINTNFTTYSLFSDLGQTYTYSNLSLSFKLPGRVILTPQAQFDYNNEKFISAKCGMEKRLFKNGFMNLSYERNFKSDFSNIELGFRYDLPFAQTGFSARRGNGSTTLVQSASGSLMMDAKTDYVGASSRVSAGKGGLVLLPYLDLNCNGQREPGEPKAYGLNVHLNGGRIETSEKDTSIRVFDLEAYTNYLVTLDGTNFDNIAWQMQVKTIRVSINPNLFKVVEIPVAVVGEAAGTIYLEEGGRLKGQGRVIVNFYRKDSSLAASQPCFVTLTKEGSVSNSSTQGILPHARMTNTPTAMPDLPLVARTLSESDGYFSYMGLAPGEYEARIDTAQLNKLNWTVSPASINFTITAGIDGDVADGLEFVLRPNQDGMEEKEKATPSQNVKTR